MSVPIVRMYHFKDDGVMPNHPFLPVILYVGALRGRADRAEAIFNEHNWRNSWIGGVFPYHHYHSNAHEVLGVISGSAVLQLGGEQGEQIVLEAGDVVILPAGTAHKRLSASPDFSVAGAYPDGMDYNMRTGKDGERTIALDEIRSVPVPAADPVYGGEGPLIELWNKH
jgi:uncharacterized protein YjlB